MNDLYCGSTIRSYVLIATEVNATGLRSFILPSLLFLGTGMMQELFHISGTTRTQRHRTSGREETEEHKVNYFQGLVQTGNAYGF